MLLRTTAGRPLGIAGTTSLGTTSLGTTRQGADDLYGHLNTSTPLVGAELVASPETAARQRRGA